MAARARHWSSLKYIELLKEQKGMAMATIVVVEDEKELNDIMCMYLRDAGYTVHGCLSANEA